jgi:hypothetical protein
LLHGIDHAAQLVVAVRGIASEYFHHPGIEALLIGGVGAADRNSSMLRSG